MLEELFVKETIKAFRSQKELAEKAMAQVSDEEFFQEPGPRSHSIAKTVKHVAGNLESRWKDFLTTDGEKPDRDRDSEFQITSRDSRSHLMAFWEQGWKTLFDTLEGLEPRDLAKTVRIRNEPHSVPLAVQRSLAHTSYHAGQITYLSRLLKQGEWQWLTIAPGQSQQFNQSMSSQRK